jgi:RNA polymerase primary sigma factor
MNISQSYTADPILQQYIKDIKLYPLLSKSEVVRLSRIIKENKNPKEYIRARNKLVSHNLLLVVGIALRYYTSIKHIGNVHASLMDLIQAGNLGLIKAAEYYDGAEGTTFATYAHLCITRNIHQYIATAFSFIRLPKRYHQYLSIINQLKDKPDKVLDDDAIMKELKISAITLDRIKHNIEHRRTEVDDWSLLIETFVDERQNVMATINRNEIYNCFLEKLQRLKPSYQKILFDRYIAGRTIPEIAADMGKSKQFVHQTIPTALRILKLLIEEDKRFNKFAKNEKYRKEKSKNDNTKLFNSKSKQEHNRGAHKITRNTSFARDLLRLPKEKVQRSR